jgi:hypothetical protein
MRKLIFDKKKFCVFFGNFRKKTSMQKIPSPFFVNIKIGTFAGTNFYTILPNLIVEMTKNPIKILS